MAHAVCGVIAALLVLTHVFLHTKAITKEKFVPNVGLGVVLITVIAILSMAAFKGVTPRSAKRRRRKGQYGQHNSGGNDRKPKDGERK